EKHESASPTGGGEIRGDNRDRWRIVLPMSRRRSSELHRPRQVHRKHKDGEHQQQGGEFGHENLACAYGQARQRQTIASAREKSLPFERREQRSDSGRDDDEDQLVVPDLDKDASLRKARIFHAIEALIVGRQRQKSG